MYYIVYVTSSNIEMHPVKAESKEEAIEKVKEKINIKADIIKYDVEEIHEK